MKAAHDRSVFSLRELADLAGLSKPRLTRLLTASRIPLGRAGNRRIVFRHDLEDRFPGLTDSIRLRVQGKGTKL